jgi:hypothetical protein
VSALTASEQLFELYLTQNGYQFAHEPDLGIVKRPDYLISRTGVEAVCEVKQFETTAMRDRLGGLGRGVGMLGSKHVFGAVRNQLDAAARQLKPLAGGERALVVVLSNPLGADVRLSPQDVVWAMYGNPTVGFAIDSATGELVSPPTNFADQDGALTAKHAYISAVATLHERSLEQDWADETAKRFEKDPEGFLRYVDQARQRGEVPTGTRQWVHLFHTVSACEEGAVRLPDAFFDGPDDRAWHVVDDAYEPMR